MNLKVLTRALYESWGKDTAYKDDKDKWTEANRGAGQCAITAMIVYDYFGGEIYRGYSKKDCLYHYWNMIDGKKVDLTASQFQKEIYFDKIVLKKKDQLLKIANVRQRYHILKERVDNYIAER
uniref:Uncharacterized protein n=1 Tax=Eubacterium plexicaudatum ASF492 TaxID=1235802 RepID=N2AHF6_9FIRM